MKNVRFLTAVLFALMATGPMHAQQPLTPEQKEKKMRESIDNIVNRYEENLNLEVWQTFYVDSILTKNMGGMFEELESLGMNGVMNPDIYSRIQDKWDEATYTAFRAILDEDQGAKYLKMGAGRAKKARDTRAAKREAN